MTYECSSGGSWLKDKRVKEADSDGQPPAETFVRPRITLVPCDVVEDDTSDTHTQSSGNEDDYFYKGTIRARQEDSGSDYSADNDKEITSPTSAAETATSCKRQCRARATSPRLACRTVNRRRPVSSAVSVTTTTSASSMARKRVGASSVPRALADAAGQLTTQASNLALNPRTVTSSHIHVQKAASALRRDDLVPPRKRRSAAVVLAGSKQKVACRQRTVPAAHLPVSFRPKLKHAPHFNSDAMSAQVAALTPYLADVSVTSAVKSLTDDLLSYGSGVYTVSESGTVIVQHVISNKLAVVAVENALQFNDAVNSGSDRFRTPAIAVNNSTTIACSSARFTSNYASEIFGISLQVVVQPEPYHRARYQKEGSRGCIKGRGGQDYPSVQLLGENHTGPVVLQAYLGRDSQRPLPNVLYKACKVGGKQAGAWVEKSVNGTPLLESQVDDASCMTVALDCLGVMKVRNADLEQALQANESTDSLVARRKRGSLAAKARIVFRAVIKAPEHVRNLALAALASVPGAQKIESGIVSSETFIVLHAVSSNITCTSSPGTPEIYRISHHQVPSSGGIDVFIIGKNFVKDDSCVIIREPSVHSSDSRPVSRSDDEAHSHPHESFWLWETEVQVNKEFFQATHLIVRMPPFRFQQSNGDGLACKCLLFVHNKASGTESEGYPFSYVTTHTSQMYTGCAHGADDKADTVGAKSIAQSMMLHATASQSQFPRTKSPRHTEYGVLSPALSAQPSLVDIRREPGSARYAAADSDGDVEIVSPPLVAARQRRRATAPHVYYPHNHHTTDTPPCISPIMQRLMISPSLSNHNVSFAPSGGGGFSSLVGSNNWLTGSAELSAALPEALTTKRRASVSQNFPGGCIMEELQPIGQQPVLLPPLGATLLVSLPTENQQITMMRDGHHSGDVSFAPPQTNAEPQQHHLPAYLEVRNVKSLQDSYEMSSPLQHNTLSLNSGAEQSNAGDAEICVRSDLQADIYSGSELLATSAVESVAPMPNIISSAAVHPWLGVSHAHHPLHHAVRHHPYPSSPAAAAAASLTSVSLQHHSSSNERHANNNLVYISNAAEQDAGVRSSAPCPPESVQPQFYMPAYHAEQPQHFPVDSHCATFNVQCDANGLDAANAYRPESGVAESVNNVTSFYPSDTQPPTMPSAQEQQNMQHYLPTLASSSGVHSGSVAQNFDSRTDVTLSVAEQRQQQQDDILLSALDDLLNAGFLDNNEPVLEQAPADANTYAASSEHANQY